MTNLPQQLDALYARFNQSSLALSIFVRQMQRFIEQDEKQFARINSILEASDGRVPVDQGNGKIAYAEIPLDELNGAISAIRSHREEVAVRFPNMLYEMAFIYFVATFDAFLTDAFTAAVLSRPDALKSGKQLTYEKIIELHEKGDLIPYMAERELHELSYKSVRDQARYLAARFNIKLEDSGVTVDALSEIRARRNLLVHNSGIVNSLYLDVVPNSDYESGQRIEISADYWNDMADSLKSLAGFVYRAVMEKFGGGDRAASPNEGVDGLLPSRTQS